MASSQTWWPSRLTRPMLSEVAGCYTSTESMGELRDLGDVVLHGIWAGPDSVVVVGEVALSRRIKTSTSWVIEDSGTFNICMLFLVVTNRRLAVGNEGTILHYTGSESGWRLEANLEHQFCGVWANPRHRVRGGCHLWFRRASHPLLWVSGRHPASHLAM